MAGFIFGAGTPYKSHEDLKRQRAIADRLSEIVMSNQGASSLPEGLMDFGTGIMAGLMRRRADKTEARGRADFNSRFNSVTRSLLGGGRKAAASPAGISASVSPTSVATPKAGKAAMGLIEYANQSAIRDDPLSAELTSALNSVLPELGVTAKVFSGGQEPTGPRRTGSTRHDHGNAADVFFYKDGRRLDWRNPNDIPLFQEIVRRGKAAGLTGFGAGEGYMQPGSMHIGFGSPGVWGAGGRGVNAPGWLRAAFNDGGASEAMASAPQAAPMGNGMQIMPVSAPAEPQIMPTSAPAMGRPATAFQRSEMARLENEVGVPTQQREARRQAIMGQQGGSAPSGGGFFTNMVPQGAPPEQMAQVQQAEVALEAMPIEQIAELASSPFAEPWQQNLMQKYLEHRMEQQFAPPPDPMEQRRKELELQKLEQDLQPKPQGRPATAEEKRALGVPETAPIFIKPDGTPELLDVSKLNPQQADPTTNMRELAQINQERAAKGQQPLGLEEFLQSKRSGGITVGPDGTVQIGGPPGKLTEQQSKDVGFYNRASQVAPILDQIDVNLTQTLSAAGSSIPGVGNYLQTDAYRQARQAGDEFMMALLRKDTGAAVTEGEMALYGQTYLPRAGDDPQTIQQKREARARAIEGIRMGLGPAQILFREREMQGQGEQTQTNAPAPAASPEQGRVVDPVNPQPGDVVLGYRFKGGNRRDPNNWEAVQ